MGWSTLDDTELALGERLGGCNQFRLWYLGDRFVAQIRGVYDERSNRRRRAKKVARDFRRIWSVSHFYGWSRRPLGK